MCKIGIPEQYVNPFKTGYFETGQHDMSLCSVTKMPKKEEKPKSASDELSDTLKDMSFVL